MTGFGIVALDVSDPPTHRNRPDFCGAFGHPAVTFNASLGADLKRSAVGSSWCLCGRTVVDGNRVEWPKPTDCGGYLVDCRHDGGDR